MDGMNITGKLFADELTEWSIEAGFIQSQCQMSIYYQYAPDGEKIAVSSYVDYYVYWYISETIGKQFVENLGKRFHVIFLGYTYWFMLFSISQKKYHYISVDQAIYYTSIVAKYLDTGTVNTSTKFLKTTLPSDMILTKDNASTSDEQFEKLTREINNHYIYCIISLNICYIQEYI